MRIGGWKTRSVFERYAIIDQKDIRAAVEDLEASQGNSYNSATIAPLAGQTAGGPMVN